MEAQSKVAIKKRNVISGEFSFLYKSKNSKVNLNQTFCIGFSWVLSFGLSLDSKPKQLLCNGNVNANNGSGFFLLFK